VGNENFHFYDLSWVVDAVMKSWRSGLSWINVGLPAYQGSWGLFITQLRTEIAR